MSFTFKINKKSVENLDSSIKKAFDKVIRSQAMLNEIGNSITSDIVDQTRNKAKSIPDKSRLASLSKGWIERRKKLSDYNETDSTFAPTKSNLTFTGQLLNALMHKITGIGKLQVGFFDSVHEPYKNKDGKSIGNPIKNEDLARYVAEQGRPFIGIRDLTKRKINRIVRTYVRRALNVAKLLKQNIDN